MLRRDEESAQARTIPQDAERTAVEAARQDPRRFEALYRKYVAQVYSFALYELRNPHLAEDVTARVFTNALAGLGRFRERDAHPHAASSFRVWLFQIARNAIANERRGQRRHPEASLDLALDVRSDDDPVAEVVHRDELAAAYRALEQLPEERRRALVLRFVLELSTAEIGALMGRSEGAVRVLIHRALRTVGRSLPERD
ncbi:MAG TPA: sigma-70 family RNA polymerase sigma factor [Candidatus Limnocylindrales bacterium]|nr:sigma-70 family RNA polymerase sigma factor [Candidatus Limnocylindrales bacterium]